MRVCDGSSFVKMFTAYAQDVDGDHKCGFRRNRSITDDVFCIRQVREKNYEYNEAVHINRLR